MILAAKKTLKEKKKKENFKPKILCPPHWGTQLRSAAGAQCSPLSLRTTRSPSSSSPFFSRGTSSAGCRRAVASPLHKTRLICVLFTFESRTLPQRCSLNIVETIKCHIFLLGMWQQGLDKLTKENLFRLTWRQWHRRGPHAGFYWGFPRAT